jgi:hypothetical protein
MVDVVTVMSGAEWCELCVLTVLSDVNYMWSQC